MNVLNEFVRNTEIIKGTQPVAAFVLNLVGSATFLPADFVERDVSLSVGGVMTQT